LPNTLPPNQVAASGTMLTSLQESAQYQWYKNGSSISGGTGRSLSYDGQGGVYVVVTLDESCNLVSEPYAVTGLLGEGNTISIYPNPASDFIRIGFSNPGRANVTLIDLLGRSVLELGSTEQETTINIRAVPGGVYILQVSFEGLVTRSKMIIQH